MSAGPRSRSRTALANDEALRVAGVKEILRVGIDGLSLREVAGRAGLTHGAAYARFEDVHEFLVDLWNAHLCAEVVEMLQLCLRVAQDRSKSAVSALVTRLRERRSQDRAAVELLLTCRRIPVMHEEIEPFIDKYLFPQSGDGVESAEINARFLCLVAICLSSVLMADGFVGDLTYDLEKILIMAQRSPGVDVPTLAEPVKGPRAITPGDTLRQNLEYATCLAIGRSGYHGATVSRIARLADCSPGAIYKMYKSKEELALVTLRDTGGLRWLGFSDLPRVLTPGVMSSVLSFETGESNRLRRNFLLETVLAANAPQLNSEVRNQLLNPAESLTRLLAGNVKGETLRRVIEPLSILVNGVRWLSTLMPQIQWQDFSEQAESFVRAISSSGGGSGGLV